MDVTRAISVVGLGRLGAPLAACLAARGWDVVGVDADPAKVGAVNDGIAPVPETGLEELLGLVDGRLRATTDIAEAVGTTDVAFVVVATPTEESGGFSLEHVLPVCRSIGRALRAKDRRYVVVLVSTVMPGSMAGEIRDALEQTSGKECGVDFGLCYNPAFVALGSVIRQFLEPDFVLIGESDERSGKAVAAVHELVCENDPPIVRMNLVNAELAKLAVNTYVTTKIAFANTLARMCERLPDADVDIVTAALGLDPRIGSKSLRAGTSYGGPCFPRDNLALAALGRSIGVPALIAEATDRSNRAGIAQLAELVTERLPPDGTVGVLGLAYKPDTDVIDHAAGLLLAAALAADGVDVVAFDPAANAGAARALGSAVRVVGSAAACVRDADVVVVATPWSEFGELDPGLFAGDGRYRVVVDCWRMLPRERFESVTDYVVGGMATETRVAGA